MKIRKLCELTIFQDHVFGRNVAIINFIKYYNVLKSFEIIRCATVLCSLLRAQLKHSNTVLERVTFSVIPLVNISVN